MNILEKFNLKENLSNSAEERWSKKTIKKELFLPLDNYSIVGIGEIVRNDDGFVLHTNAETNDSKPRVISYIKLEFSNLNLDSYNRLSFWVYPKSNGFYNFYSHFTIFNKDSKPPVHAPCLTPNQWNNVLWEITDIKRNSIESITFGPVLLGTPDEALPDIEFHFKNISAQEINPDYIEGWDLENRIAFSHSGYFTFAEKVAITQNIIADSFEVIDNNNFSHTFPTKKVHFPLGEYFLLDFTKLKKPGKYYIKIQDVKTPTFVISDFPYYNTLVKSLNFINSLRCGDEVIGVHSPCHLNSYTFHPNGQIVPNHGGWHDAADVSQFEICTAEITYALLEVANALNENDFLTNDITNEGRWGANWLLRTRFKDGQRALAVLYAIWQKNVFSNINELSKNNVSENSPFENFLAAAALAISARTYKNQDPIYSNWCLRTAEEDFWFGEEGRKQGLYTKRWGPIPTSQLCGQGALAAAELYLVTKDKKYLEIGKMYAKLILAAQEQFFPSWDYPLRGFFYKDEKHDEFLNYEHRGHEQTPVIGLVRMYEVFPNDPDSNHWLNGIKLYREYIIKTANLCAPFNLLPATIYNINKINLKDHTIPAAHTSKEEATIALVTQAKQGIKLADNIYLRRFPLAIQRRGFHATLLSKTKAVSNIAKLLNDNELAQIAINQLEWILGKNPFAASTMYGEGYNYHPLYVAFSNQIIGALPVGIQTKDNNDLPYWPTTCISVFKEIWGHTTGKFIGILADLITMYKK